MVDPLNDHCGDDGPHRRGERDAGSSEADESDSGEARGAPSDREFGDVFVEQCTSDGDRHERCGGDDDARGARRDMTFGPVQEELIRGHPEKTASDDPAEVPTLKRFSARQLFTIIQTPLTATTIEPAFAA